MMYKHSHKTSRNGVVALLMAFLLIPILAMAAFAVDIGWIVLSKSDVQNAADAAALAGAQQLVGQMTLSGSNGKYTLMNGFAQYYLAGQLQQGTILTTAKTAASKYAKDVAYYHAGGKTKNLVLLDSDIDFGFVNSAGNYTALPAYTGFPNTIKVTIRLDTTTGSNGALPLFFGPVLGKSTQNVIATAGATIYSGTINNFNTSGTQPSGILPMTYDYYQWQNYLQTGLSPDGTISPGPNGAPQLDIYPSIKFTGNFGLLSLDQGNNGASTISGWIDNGVPASALANEVSAGLLPLSSHDPNSAPDWKGNPGLKTSDIHSVANHVGETYLMPVYSPDSPRGGSFPVTPNPIENPATYQAGTGQGSHYYYTIVAFVGVRITYVDNKSISVQPAAVTDPNAIFTNVAPAAPPTPGSPLITTFTTSKMSF